MQRENPHAEQPYGLLDGSMKILITGAAGNLGSFLAKSMLDGPHELRLMIHERELSFDVEAYDHVSVFRADLSDPETLLGVCRGSDCIVHFAGVLFQPWPERFLPETNVEFVRNLVRAALEGDVSKFILISFPHVEGETTPNSPANGRRDGEPGSIHAQTRLHAERYLFSACEGRAMTPIALRPGMIYARGVLMIDAARELLARRLLPVWRAPTWIHLLSLPDFLACVLASIENENVEGIYNLGDDEAITLQEFLDRAAATWGSPRPWRAPKWAFYSAAFFVEMFAWIFRKPAPITRDFIRIGMASYYSDTSRMKSELRPELELPTFRVGRELL
jgi:nucleoside-diphosphate-sugar epimerase